MVDADGLGDLKKADQLKPVQSLGSRLVTVNLGESCVDGRVGGDKPVDVRESEEPIERRASSW